MKGEAAGQAGTRMAQARQAALPFLSQGFRPFFLAAAGWAIVAVAVWIAILVGGGSLPSRFDPLAWHVHEMLFGFVMAAIAGFLLTAVPNWTGRLPVNGAPLAGLAGLWLLGRAACLFSAALPAWLATAADLSFAVGLVALISREIAVGANWRSLPMIVPVAVLAIANLLMHLEAYGAVPPGGLGWRLAIAAVVVLISVVAGRIVPSFTRNWMAKRGYAVPEPHGLCDRASLGVLHAGLLIWVFLPDSAAAGVLLLAAAALNAWRLTRWRGAKSVGEPLLLILHVSYAWLVLGVALLGLSLLIPDVPRGAAIHALTAGAIGTMILAVMTRVTLGHTGRELTAGGPTVLLYVLVTLAAVTRVAAGFAVAWYQPLLIVSAASWVAAFGGFVIVYGPMLLRPRFAG
jgi:uncharacterized protein involved in response to NO